VELPDIVVYDSMKSFAGNLPCAVDVETTGTEAGYHEIVQIAIQPLDMDFKPYEGVLPFYVELKPDYPLRASKKAMEVNGMSLVYLQSFGVPQETCQDMLLTWFQSLKLANSRRLLPMAHNWPFDYSFISNLLGPDLFSEIFCPHYRDTMELALSIVDLAAISGCAKLPFKSFNLRALCGAFGIPYHPDAHDALEDSLAVAKLFPLLLRMLRHFSA